MTREMMISELLKKGYNVAPKDTVKNGVLKKGIAFLSAPTLSRFSMSMNF